MKLVLINPPTEVPEKLFDTMVRISQPNGIAYLAAVLRNAGHKVRIIDALAPGWKKQNKIGEEIHVGLEYTEIISELKEFNPDIIGITVVSSIRKEDAYKLASEIRKNMETKIVLGGPHPTVAPEDCLAQPSVDIVAMGEGEELIIELVNALENKQSLKNIKGIAYKEKGKIKHNERRNPPKELDKIPFPARDLLPMEDYFASSRALLSTFYLSTYNKKWATINTSRGCPHDCVFCSIKLVAGQRWRSRSAENVVEEIEELVKNYGVQHIAFLDDNLTLHKARIEKICDLILEKKLKFEWSAPNGVRADTLDEKLLRKMKASGCKRICLAPESGSQRVVTEVIKKRMKLEDIENAVIRAKKVGMQVDCFFVIGLIGETKEEIKQTLNYARKLKKLGAYGFNFAVATPFRGTELYDQAKNMGMISDSMDDQLSIFGDEPLIETSEFTKEDLKQFRAEANKIAAIAIFDYIDLMTNILIKDPKRFLRLSKKVISSVLNTTKYTNWTDPKK